MKNDNRSCPICFSFQKRLLYNQIFYDDNDIGLVSGYRVVVCQKCGFAFADNIPEQKDFNHYYAKMSKYEFNDHEGRASRAHFNHYSNMVNYIIPHVPDRDARILDIGCSTGGLLWIFKSQGYSQLKGIDPSPLCVRTARKLYGLDVSVDDIANYSAARKYDVVILSATLEHLAAINESIEKIRSLMSDTGLLFIEVPDTERFDAYITAPFQQFSVEHINYFSRISLKNFLSRHFFEVFDVKQEKRTFAKAVDPDIFVLARKARQGNREVIKDNISEAAIKRYIEKCLKFDSEIKKNLRDKLSGIPEVIVWGVGTHTQRLLGSGLDPKKIVSFVDSNERYAGKKLNGIEIMMPQSIQRQDIPIFISTHTYQDEITHQIREGLKLSNDIITVY